MRLRANDRCPIHNGRRDCCGRAEAGVGRIGRKYESLGPGITKIPDEHHPRGYRVRRSKSAMNRLLAKKVVEQKGICSLCNLPMTDAREIGPDHTDPRGMGGARKDDHEDNITACHNECNREKGSRRL